MTYYITAVEYNNFPRKHISHVLLHQTDGLGNILKGTRVSKANVIALLPQNDIRTLRWNYLNGTWISGAKVETETVGGNLYLRTHPNAREEDNLEHLPLLTLWL